MRKIIISFLIFFVFANLLFVDVWIYQRSQSRENKSSSTCDFSRLYPTMEGNNDGRTCPSNCLNAIKNATSSSKTDITKPVEKPPVVITQTAVVTQIVTQPPVVAETNLKEYFVNFGASVWTAGTWQGVPDLSREVNLSQYGKIKKIYFEVIAHLSNENTSGLVRLFNVSDKSTVSGSETNFNSMKCQIAVSSAINLESYSKKYQVQVKTNENATMYIDQSRLRIIAE